MILSRAASGTAEFSKSFLSLQKSLQDSWEQAASHFSIPDIKLMCAPALLEEAGSILKIFARDKNKKKRNKKTSKSTTAEAREAMAHGTHYMPTWLEEKSTCTQSAFKSSCPDVSAQLHVSNVLWAVCNRPNKPVLLCRTPAGKWKHNHNSEKLKLTSAAHAL